MRLAFRVAHVIMASIIRRPLMVGRANVVRAIRRAKRFVSILTTMELVTAQPSRSHQVIFIALMRQVNAIGRRHGPLQFIIQRSVNVILHGLYRVPKAIQFRVYLVGRMGTVLVARLVGLEHVQMVTNASHISIVLLRHTGVLTRLFLQRVPSTSKARLITIRTLGSSPPSIWYRGAILRLGPTRPSTLQSRFLWDSHTVTSFGHGIVGLQIFHTPRGEPLRIPNRSLFPFNGDQFIFRRDLSIFFRSSFRLTTSPRLWDRYRFNDNGYYVQRYPRLCVVNVCFQRDVRMCVTMSSKGPRRVLVLTPTTHYPLGRLCHRFIFPIFCHVNRFGLEQDGQVLTMASRYTIWPSYGSTLHTLGQSGRPLPLRLLQRNGVFSVTYRQIGLLQSLTQVSILVTFPQVLRIDMLQRVMALRLSVDQGLSIVPACATMIFLLGSNGCINVIFYVIRLPRPIWASTMKALFLFYLLFHPMVCIIEVHVRTHVAGVLEVFCFLVVGYVRERVPLSYCNGGYPPGEGTFFAVFVWPLQ